MVAQVLVLLGPGPGPGTVPLPQDSSWFHGLIGPQTLSSKIPSHTQETGNMSTWEGQLISSGEHPYVFPFLPMYPELSCADQRDRELLPRPEGTAWGPVPVHLSSLPSASRRPFSRLHTLPSISLHSLSESSPLMLLPALLVSEVGCSAKELGCF